MRTVLLLATVALVACAPTTAEVPGGNATTGLPGGFPTGTPSGNPGGTAGGTAGGSATADSISNLSWELHDIKDALVWVSWDQATAGDITVEYEVDKGVWLSAPEFAGEAGTNTQLIVGIPYAHDAEWRVVASSGTFDGPTITTGDLPSGLPLATIEVADEANWLPDGHFFLTSINQDQGGWVGGTYWSFMIDRKGRVVWAHKTPNQHWTLYVSVARSGDHILWDEATYWSSFGNGGDGKVHRTYLDAPIETIDTPGIHHAFWEHLDGTLAWGSKAHGGGEALVEKTPGQTDETIIWECHADWLGGGSCESNCLYYEPSRDAYLYSFYTNSSMAEVHRSKGSTLWWAGEEPGGWAFDPPNSQFSWQHGVTWTPQGTLLLSTEGGDGGWQNVTTWVREYEVDEANQVLREVWSYDSTERADTNGDARRLANGNLIHVIGSAGHIKELDPAGNTVWHVNFNAEKLLGRGEFVPDPYALLSPQ